MMFSSRFATVPPLWCPGVRKSDRQHRKRLAVQTGKETVIRELVREVMLRLPRWSSRDPLKRWLETLGDVAK